MAAQVHQAITSDIQRALQHAVGQANDVFTNAHTQNATVSKKEEEEEALVPSGAVAAEPDASGEPKKKKSKSKGEKGKQRADPESPPPAPIDQLMNIANPDPAAFLNAVVSAASATSNAVVPAVPDFTYQQPPFSMYPAPPPPYMHFPPPPPSYQYDLPPMPSSSQDPPHLFPGHNLPPDLSFGSNDDILRAVQDLDLSKLANVLKTLGEAAAAANMPFFDSLLPPQPTRHSGPPPVDQTPSLSNVILSVPPKPPAKTPRHSRITNIQLHPRIRAITRNTRTCWPTSLVYKKGKFSAIEEQQLSNAIETYCTRQGLANDDLINLIFTRNGKDRENSFWTEITSAVPLRPIIAVYHHVRRKYHPLQGQGRWMPTEDALLKQAVGELGQQWEKVSMRVGRMASDCRDRYRNHLEHREHRAVGVWSKEEEDILTQIVTEMTVNQGKDPDNDVFWGVISRRMGNKRGRQQCRIKWLDSLSKTVKNQGQKPRWSLVDAYILVHKVQSLNVRDDSEIDWKTLPDPNWNFWSAHALQRRWLTMKRGIQIMDILLVKNVHLPVNNGRRHRKITSAEAVEDSDEDEDDTVQTADASIIIPTVDMQALGNVEGGATDDKDDKDSTMSDKGFSLDLGTRRRRRRPILFVSLVSLVFVCNTYLSYSASRASPSLQTVPVNAQETMARCSALKMTPGPHEDFYEREESDRWEPGTNATLIRNATVWTGELEGGETVVHGDVLLDRGIIKAVGDVPASLLRGMDNLTVVDAEGAWVTPGLVDLHSHIGIYTWPALAGGCMVPEIASQELSLIFDNEGGFELNSYKGPVLPWLRSIDAFHTHDEAAELAIAGGVTSIQVLPGSANAIGGQSFMVKLRKTSERSPSSMIIEPPHGLNGTQVDPHARPRWRHLKQAAGENLDTYGNRMDSMWSFRAAYNEARKIKVAQDVYCAKAEAGLWDMIHGDYPENLQWEALVDVLRGRVKITQHVYEAVDIDTIVRLSNEFQFHIASFHHAAEAYLVPDVLKRAWGGPPAVALFANNYGYKREAYRGSVFAPRVLADNGIPVIMKTDHPALNGRYLLYEAQKAHYYGLPAHLALASVTSTPAAAAGLAHRIGVVRRGADADVVLWDSHPLRVGATPKSVWIDGIMQVGEGVVVGRGKEGREWREVPQVPDWTEERRRAVEWDGVPPLEAGSQGDTGRVVFRNVSEMLRVARGRGGDDVDSVVSEWNLRGGETDVTRVGEEGIVVVDAGKVICAGIAGECDSFVEGNRGAHIRMVDLRGGSLAPALIAFGSALGLEEIQYESTTGDGSLYDPFTGDVPSILDDTGGIVRAVDALQFQTRNAL
ncbi:hypothetical protein EW146_g9771 [Bondarzewia mesenterica]|uniref:Uncharacterized protein n=1 Tax=Bondarzewia mesenterica TaxID=1095465 RepID=A0A4S4L3G0_9AGAM|nr:hypothetical protein EW146_g9771 [Bondarzewia mesenterica]